MKKILEKYADLIEIIIANILVIIFCCLVFPFMWSETFCRWVAKEINKLFDLD